MRTLSVMNDPDNPVQIANALLRPRTGCDGCRGIMKRVDTVVGYSA